MSRGNNLQEMEVGVKLVVGKILADLLQKIADQMITAIC